MAQYELIQEEFELVLCLYLTKKVTSTSFTRIGYFSEELEFDQAGPVGGSPTVENFPKEAAAARSAEKVLALNR